MPPLEHEEIALLGGRREVAKNIMAAFIDHDGESPLSIPLESGTPMA